MAFPAKAPGGHLDFHLDPSLPVVSLERWISASLSQQAAAGATCSARETGTSRPQRCPSRRCLGPDRRRGWGCGSYLLSSRPACAAFYWPGRAPPAGPALTPSSCSSAVLRGTGCPAAARGVVMLRYHHGSRRSPGASVAALKTACPLATTPANDPLPQSGSAQLERSVTGFSWER